MARSVKSQHLSSEYDRMLAQKQQIEASERAAVEAPLRAEIDRLRAEVIEAREATERADVFLRELEARKAWPCPECAATCPHGTGTGG